jgi:hypothetical protein
MPRGIRSALSGDKMIDSGNALLMLKKWADEHTPLLFRVESVDVAFAISGTVSSASIGDCIVRSGKGDATLRFGIDNPDCKFEFADRRFLASLAESSEIREDTEELASLLIFFPARFSLEDVRLTKQGSRVSLSITEVHFSELKGG